MCQNVSKYVKMCQNVSKCALELLISICVLSLEFFQNVSTCALEVVAKICGTRRYGGLRPPTSSSCRGLELSKVGCKDFVSYSEEESRTLRF